MSYFYNVKFVLNAEVANLKSEELAKVTPTVVRVKASSALRAINAVRRELVATGKIKSNAEVKVLEAAVTA